MNMFLFCLWGAFYILNFGLSFLTANSVILKVAMMVLAVSSFVPGCLLLIRGYQNKNRKLVLSVRWICLTSLILTTIGLVAFFLCAAFASVAVFNVVSILLAIVSVPMFSSQIWVLSLSLWALLLSATFLKTENRK